MQILVKTTKSPRWFYFIPVEVGRIAWLSLYQIWPVMDEKKVAVLNGPVEDGE